jgi:hypothetical protein
MHGRINVYHRKIRTARHVSLLHRAICTERPPHGRRVDGLAGKDFTPQVVVVLSRTRLNLVEVLTNHLIATEGAEIFTHATSHTVPVAALGPGNLPCERDRTAMRGGDPGILTAVDTLRARRQYRSGSRHQDRNTDDQAGYCRHVSLLDVASR